MNIPTLTPLPDYGELITLIDFQNSPFIPYDGDGYYATSEGMDRKSDVWKHETPPAWATHVMWFNK